MSLTGSPLAPVEEMIHGVLVRDPYRWLEDRSLQETEEWIREQQRRCDRYFGDLPGMKYLRSRVAEYLDVERIDQPVRVGERFFYRRRRRGQEQPCICVKDSQGNTERILVDPSPMGKFANVAIRRISEDGSRLAYELRHGGADVSEIRCVDTITGNTLADTLGIGYCHGLVFAPDAEGYFYCHESTSPTGDHSIRFHRFGETVEDSVLFRVQRTRCSRLVLIADETHLGAIYNHEGDCGLLVNLYVAKYGIAPEWRCVIANREAPDFPLLKRGRIFLYSEQRASNGRLLELNEDGSECRVLVPEAPTKIGQTVFVDDRVYVSYCADRATQVRSWPISGTSNSMSIGDTVNLPRSGTIQLLQHLGSDTSTLYYSYESFTQPICIFEYSRASGTSRMLSAPNTTVRNYDCDVQTVFYASSKDATPIPMSLLTCNRLTMQGACPVILSSYGGFGASVTPSFSVLSAMMLELGAVLAFPNIRGGGEFGYKWHEAAQGRNREVAIDDCVDAAAWLLKEGVTAPSRIGLIGGSNAGLLVGSAITQYPDMFRAAVCIAPLLDMVRYEQFDRAAKWQREYGSARDPQDFQALYSYSPYHQVREGANYPAILFISGDSDDRCNPAHVRKMAARLQSLCSQTNRIIVDYSEERGHAPVLPLSVRIDALTRRVAFLCTELNIAVRGGGTHAVA